MKQSNVFTRFLPALAALAVVTGAISPALAQTNLLQNGGFELMTPGFLGEGYKTLAIGTPSPDLPNWSLTPPGNADVFYWGLNPQSYFPAAEEGTHYLNICTGGYGWDVSGTVSQSFAVTGGTAYTVSYYGAARDDTTEKIQADLSLSAGTGGGSHVTAALPLSWTHQTFTFTPSVDATATLTFAVKTPTGYYYGTGVYLDDVSVSLGASAMTTETVVTGNGTSTFNEEVKLTATVSPTPTSGTVQFYDGSTPLSVDPVPVGGDGKASLSKSDFSVGTHHITATFTSGTTGFLGSTSLEVDQIVNPLLSADSIINGSFETMKVGNQGVALAFGTPSGDLLGWNLSGTGLDQFAWGIYPTGGWPSLAPVDGVRYLNISCGDGQQGPASAFTASQGFLVTGGTQYTVSYSVASRDGQANQGLHAAIALSSGTGEAYQDDVTSIQEWAKKTFTFTPSENATATLSFTCTTPTYWGTGVYLDDVSVSLGTSPVTTYETWASTKYPGFGLTNPEADLDGDGMSNFQEYAFGLDPTSGASVNPLTDTSVLHSAGQFSYTRTADTGLTYTVWTSTDLADWGVAPAAATQVPRVPAVDGVETVDVTLTGYAPPVGGKFFVRVQAE